MQKFKLEMEKNALCSSKFEEVGHPTEESHSPIQATCNLRDPCYTTEKEGEIHMMRQEIINFNQEKYEVLNYKNENSQNLWQKYHKSHQSKDIRENLRSKMGLKRTKMHYKNQPITF